jgi:hypothetical protein
MGKQSGQNEMEEIEKKTERQKEAMNTYWKF